MTLIKENNMNILKADEGKHIRDINDVYVPAGFDEQGKPIEEHFPYYTTIIYLPLFMTIEQINKLYVEESINGFV